VPRKPVTLGEYEFLSKKEAKELFSSILNDCELGETLEGKNFDYVMALLLNHPRASKKIGSGVKSIKVDQGHYSSNRCFHIVRNNGTTEDFSIGKCIDGDHSPFYKFCIACRRSVENEVRAYKTYFFKKNGDTEGKVRCQISGQKISFEEAHVDHREPLTFSTIVHFFVEANRIDLGSTTYTTEGKYGNEFSDDSLSNRFKNWHKRNAKLRIVNSRNNLQKSHLGRVKSTKADGVLL